MKIAVTGATGFLGRYLVRQLVTSGHQCRCWYREGSDRAGFEVADDAIDWSLGELGNATASVELVAGCDAVVHAALYRPGPDFRGGEGDLITFVEKNFVGTISLIEAARAAGAQRFVFISTCAVHEQILDDRPLDETHPLAAASHYGAHKAAIEQFVHSFALGHGYDVCALRPTGIYGVAHPPAASKWFPLVRDVVIGQHVTCRRGGKEVHAADVAKAVNLLLGATGVAGQVYNCYDRYISEYDVAMIGKRLLDNNVEIDGAPKQPKHQIETTKLRSLGMEFGGEALLQQTIQELIEEV